MKKILKNIQHRFLYQSTMIAWYIGIYVFVMTILYVILYKTNIINSYSASLSYRLWSSFLFLFITSMMFSEDFNLLITLSNSRKEIFFTFLGSGLINAGIFSILVVVEKLIFDALNKKLLLYVRDIFHNFAAYNAHNLFVTFIFFFTVFVFVTVAGTLLGSLFYRFGTKFVWGFWLGFSLLPVIGLPLLLLPLGGISSAGLYLNKIGLLLKTFDVLSVSLKLFALSVVAVTGAFLNMRSLQIK